MEASTLRCRYFFVFQIVSHYAPLFPIVPDTAEPLLLTPVVVAAADTEVLTPPKTPTLLTTVAMMAVPARIPIRGGYGQTDTRQQSQGYNSEEEDVEAVKSSIKFTKDQSVRSTRNALNAAQSAEESGMRILNNLSTQGRRLRNTEKTLDVASRQNRVAEDKARELKNLNRSMLIVIFQKVVATSKVQKF